MQQIHKVAAGAGIRHQAGSVQVRRRPALSGAHCIAAWRLPAPPPFSCLTCLPACCCLSAASVMQGGDVQCRGSAPRPGIGAQRRHAGGSVRSRLHPVAGHAGRRGPAGAQVRCLGCLSLWLLGALKLRPQPSCCSWYERQRCSLGPYAELAAAVQPGSASPRAHGKICSNSPRAAALLPTLPAGLFSLVLSLGEGCMLM